MFVSSNSRATRWLRFSCPWGIFRPTSCGPWAHLCRKHVKDTIRTTVDQNLLIRWVANGDLIEFYDGLTALSLAQVGAGRLRDVTACPGTDSCKLGITSSRGLAALLHEKFNNGLGDIADRQGLENQDQRML